MNVPRRFLSTALLAAGALALATGVSVFEGDPPLGPLGSPPGVSVLSLHPDGPGSTAKATECGGDDADADTGGDPAGRGAFPMEMFGPDPKVAAPRT